MKAAIELEMAGSAFDVDFGGDYDLALVTNFLHHFDLSTCTAFMRKVHASLRPGGRAAIVEFVPNADRVSPPTAAAFSLVMLATTPAGNAYAVEEYERLLKEAGFARVELTPPHIGLGRLIVAYR
jgi:SAM-dependent methyltransferase